MLSLTQLLSYENSAVITHFCHRHPTIGEIQAKQYFKDLLGWMWLNAQRKHKNQTTYLFGPLLKLDALWHTFILHTRDYTHFCQHYFGEYFHHDIEPIGHEYQLNPQELAFFLTDCFTMLGEDWVQRNFADLLP